VFTEIFGNSPRVKLLDFLADHVDYDYTISQLEEFAGVSRPTLYRLIPELEAEKMISPTREVGASTFYRLNTRNERVIGMLQLDFESVNRSLLTLSKRPPSMAAAPSAHPSTRRVAHRKPTYLGLPTARSPASNIVEFRKGKKKAGR